MRSVSRRGDEERQRSEGQKRPPREDRPREQEHEHGGGGREERVQQLPHALRLVHADRLAQLHAATCERVPQGWRVVGAAP